MDLNPKVFCIFLALTDATESVAILIARIVADPIPVSVITARIAEYRRFNAVVAAIVHGKGIFRFL
jgi:hypothetical protein